MQKVETQLWQLQDKSIKDAGEEVKEIGQQLREGKIIAFPTETVYGLGANALDKEAVQQIFKAKGRPSDNPLIVHIAEIDQLYAIAEQVDEKAKKLIDIFWPGPLTIIFKSKAHVPNIVTAGLPTVAVRMPNHELALEIIREAKVPIAAPSANRSGRPSPTTAEHVYEDLFGRIDGIVDGGSTGIGVESTVIDLSGSTPTILRPGGVTLEELKQVLGSVDIDPSIIKDTDNPRSPGMKYTHYAPQGEMVIVVGSEPELIQKINEMAAMQKQQGKRVGILTIEEHKEAFTEGFVLAYGTKNNLYPFAAHLYDALRSFDKQKIDYIIAEGFQHQGIGLTIMNRLHKAAGGNMIKLNK